MATYERTKEHKEKMYRISGIYERLDALKNYYNDPVRCKYCDKVLEVPPDKKPSSIKRKTFCDHSCSAKFNNLGSDNKGPNPKEKKLECGFCGDEFDKPRDSNGNLYKRKYCYECESKARRKSLRKKHRSNDKKLDENKESDSITYKLEEKTKAEIYERYDKWRTARSFINKHAHKVVDELGRTKKCQECDYDKHVELCHIKNVADFDSSAKVKVINDPDNLIYLCRNHHWEFDNDFLELT